MTRDAEGKIISVTPEEAMGVILGYIEALKDRDRRLAEGGNEPKLTSEGSAIAETRAAIPPLNPQDQF
jgi:hypothetical protein